MNYDELGFTQEELQERVVKQICDRILHEQEEMDHDGHSWFTEGEFEERVHTLIKERIDEQVEAIANVSVLPKIDEYIRVFTLQETTTWGEKVGKELTFVEYLVKRAEAYMAEDVDYKGKTKPNDAYSWSKEGTRITYAIDKHLHHSIETAMKTIMEGANEALVDGIKKTVELKLKEIVSKIKVTTDGRR